jgi:hypothetical protein
MTPGGVIREFIPGRSRPHSVESRALGAAGWVLARAKRAFAMRMVALAMEQLKRYRAA